MLQNSKHQQVFQNKQKIVQQEENEYSQIKPQVSIKELNAHEKYKQSLKDDFEDPIPKDTDLRDKFQKTIDLITDHFKEMKDEERN